MPPQRAVSQEPDSCKFAVGEIQQSTNSLVSTTGNEAALSLRRNTRLGDLMLLPFIVLGPLALGDGSEALTKEIAVSISRPSTIVLHGTISRDSVFHFLQEQAPELLWRTDVQFFLKAKSRRLRKSLLDDLYKNGCVDWKLLRKLARLARETGYI